MTVSLSKKLQPKILFVMIVTLILSLLASCTSIKTQKAILFIDDQSSSNYSLRENLTIRSKENADIPKELVLSAAKAHQVGYDERVSSFEWKEVCEDGESCFEFKGVELQKVQASDYFSPEEKLEVDLLVDEQNYAVLSILDGERLATWKFTTPKDEKPLYINIFVTDYFVSVTQLEDGYLSFTPIKPNSQSQEQSWEFEEIFKKYYINYFQRDNDWINFKYSYRLYSEAMSKASKQTCKVFGKNCDGRASYSAIASAYRNAYEKTVNPMLSSLITSSDNKDVSVALLQLEKMAKLNANCYFRTYSAAEDRNSASYNATSECFSEVTQQESDLKISLKQANYDLESFTEVGYGGYPRAFE